MQALELAELIDYDFSGVEAGLEFFHDPNKGSSDVSGCVTVCVRGSYFGGGRCDEHGLLSDSQALCDTPNT
jgi:hypothetical protein